MSAEEVFSFCRAALRGCLSFAGAVIQASVICFNTSYLDIDLDFDFDYILISIDESNSSLLKLYLRKSLTY